MTKLLYLSSSSYSGSTLFTFLVNQHPDVFTIGELEGWDYGDEEYLCSCGSPIEKCDFFNFIEGEFHKAALKFDSRDFGTKLRLVKNDRLNRYLVSSIPHVNSSVVEKARDTILWHLPGFAGRVERAKKSNTTFIKASLEYSGASLFVDATKNPYRMRLLASMNDMDLSIMYLVRDVRGVVASNVRKKGVSVVDATHQWLRDQENILRIMREMPSSFSIKYEDLCTKPNEIMSYIYKKMGLKDFEFQGAVRGGEHHILGNAMRVGSVNEITLDERWKKELSADDIELIGQLCSNYIAVAGCESLTEVVNGYIGAGA